MINRLRVLSLLSVLLLGVIVGLAVPFPALGGDRSSSVPVAEASREALLPAGVDLDVTFINRAPLYKAYCVEYPWDVPNQPGIPYLCPGTENDKRWPDQGEIVTFTAHVVNKGTVVSPPFGFAWQIDSVEVASGTLPALAPAAEITTTYQWPWAHSLSPDGQRAIGEHTVGFVVDPAGAIQETYETNNSLQDQTNAMSFSIYITPEMYAAYNIPVDPKYPYSAEDWLQKQIAAMNTNFATAIYPVTPQGADLRVRINTIQITPTNPGGDGEHDGGWFIVEDVRQGISTAYDPEEDIDWNLVHELSHQVSVIDLYAIGIVADNVFVNDRHGNPLNISCDWSNPGIMGGGDISPYSDRHRYSSHSAGGASSYTGYRNGYYGSYLYDISMQNYLRILDSQGGPASGVEVTLFQRTGPWDWTGHLGLDSTPEISGTTDANGIFFLTNRSANSGTVTLNGHILHDNPFGVVDIIGNQGVFLIRLARQDHEEFHWLDITEFNLAYWMGDTISHTFTISSHVPPPEAPSAALLTDLRVQADQATVCWRASPSPGVVGYRLYRATLPRFPYTLVGDVASGLCTDDTFYTSSYGGRVYAVTAVDDMGRESSFSNFGWVPSLTNPSSIVITGDGERIILDPRNGYALTRQGADGTYKQHVGSVHYHLEFSQFMGLDANGRLLFNHPGDAYDPRHSVRAADLQGKPALEFGEQGSGPGEFETPAGVAGWGEPCTYGGPYSVDEHTLLLLHFDGDYTGAQGQTGTANGTSFESGQFGQGVLIDGTDTLTYTTAGNLNRIEGTIEFWVKPTWSGDDMESYTFFEVGDQWFNRMRVMKDGANNLRFLLWDSATEYGVAYNVGDWRAGAWHHVAAMWQGTKIALYVDGAQVASDSNANPPDNLSAEMHVGSSLWWDQQANAVIEELHISDIARLGNSETCGRILVADSGNHRVQAFDSLGKYLAAFGGFGSEDGQFNNPQGLAVDSNDRVIVVDQGNNRLVLLSFNGESFAYLDSYTAGFNAPTGVAVDGEDNLYIADTGNNRIIVLDSEGNLVAWYTRSSVGYPGFFNSPRGVGVEANGNIVVADTGNRRVVTIRNPSGQHNMYLPVVRR